MQQAGFPLSCSLLFLPQPVAPGASQAPATPTSRRASHRPPALAFRAARPRLQAATRRPRGALCARLVAPRGPLARARRPASGTTSAPVRARQTLVAALPRRGAGLPGARERLLPNRPGRDRAAELGSACCTAPVVRAPRRRGAPCRRL